MERKTLFFAVKYFGFYCSHWSYSVWWRSGEWGRRRRRNPCGEITMPWWAIEKRKIYFIVIVIIIEIWIGYCLLRCVYLMFSVYRYDTYDANERQKKSINGRQWAADLYTLIKCIPYLGMGFRLGLTLRRSKRSDLEKWLHSWFHSKIQQHNIFHPLNFHGAKVWIENTRSHYSFWSNWGRRLPESTEKKAEEEEIIKSDIYSMPSHHPLRNPMLNRWLNAF